jgi:hypothetical protein
MRAGVGLACVVLLAACASAIQHPVPAGPKFETDDVRFAAPTGWEFLTSTSVSYGPGQILVYVANEPLRTDCRNSVAEIVCQSPLATGLHAGGMLVTWVTSTCVARGCDLPPAPLIAIGNRQGVRVPVDVGCDETGFTERSAYYATVAPQRVDVLFVCARDPSAGTRSAFLGFLDAIQWRIP